MPAVIGVGSVLLYGQAVARGTGSGLAMSLVFSAVVHGWGVLIGLPIARRLARPPAHPIGQLGTAVLHGVAAAIYALVFAALALVSGALWQGGTPWIRSYWEAQLPPHLWRGLLLYVLVAATGFALRFTARLRQLEADLAQVRTAARVQALRAPLEPHFLYNALNAISDLVKHDPAAADRGIEHLGSLLRRLSADDGDLIDVEEEADRVRAYLHLEQMRYGERLKLVWEVDPSVMEAVVPSFSLQILVENAIRHGGDDGELRVAVRIGRSETGAIAMVVDDAGTGKPPFVPGVGLSSLRDRLRLLHGNAARLAHQTRPDGRGVRATLEIPETDGES
ncbi:MAG: sensor histidine kinase [Gemmatimonadales bacterium]